ncbi:lipoprotein [Azoarcus olearius]|uniref:septal ring lytic transglycosylase RlpA family protein n=1 Tax=Azoarcus sp. (strain BH72) TaxID=418699 RepID=UPI0008062C55|nr:septal ring lytic transglycosylase RlpA family protein [Azoarcus olearius]ANQ83271.1 lipoprotein [Azoarcus olearius]
MMMKSVLAAFTLRARPLTLVVASCCAAWLAGCSTAPVQESSTSGARPSPPPPVASPAPAPAKRGGAYYKDDGPGDNPPDNLDAVPDAQPRLEPLHRFANRPYNVFGQDYVPATRLAPFRERGLASWYGRRFHGGNTSSGEPYDMYAMTAAHPTLPIPSYARVTNVATGRSVVVRINDRGPFHKGRIMDLSYTAAYRLGYVNGGSAEVEVEQILPDEVPMEAMSPPVPPLPGRRVPPALAAAAPDPAPATAAPATAAPATAAPASPSAGAGAFFLQLGAFASRDNAEGFRATVQRDLAAFAQRVDLLAEGGRFRLHAGPYASENEARVAAERIAATLKLKPFVVAR